MPATVRCAPLLFGFLLPEFLKDTLVKFRRNTRTRIAYLNFGMSWRADLSLLNDGAFLFGGNVAASTAIYN